MTAPIGAPSSLSFEMMARIEGPTGSPAPAQSPAVGGAGGAFAERVGEMLRDASELQTHADGAATSLVQGEHQDVHGTMIAMQEADVALRLVTSVRNRVVEAYREVMRMGG